MSKIRRVIEIVFYATTLAVLAYILGMNMAANACSTKEKPEIKDIKEILKELKKEPKPVIIRKS